MESEMAANRMIAEWGQAARETSVVVKFLTWLLVYQFSFDTNDLGRNLAAKSHHHSSRGASIEHCHWVLTASNLVIWKHKLGTVCSITGSISGRNQWKPELRKPVEKTWLCGLEVCRARYPAVNEAISAIWLIYGVNSAISDKLHYCFTPSLMMSSHMEA